MLRLRKQKDRCGYSPHGFFKSSPWDSLYLSNIVYVFSATKRKDPRRGPIFQLFQVLVIGRSSNWNAREVITFTCSCLTTMKIPRRFPKTTARVSLLPNFDLSSSFIRFRVTTLSSIFRYSSEFTSWRAKSRRL